MTDDVHFWVNNPFNNPINWNFSLVQQILYNLYNLYAKITPGEYENLSFAGICTEIQKHHRPVGAPMTKALSTDAAQVRFLSVVDP